MTLQNVLPWILRAQKEGWAVGAFNANTLEQAQAIFGHYQPLGYPVLYASALSGWGIAELRQELPDTLDRGEEQPLRRDLRLGVPDDAGHRGEAEPLHGAAVSGRASRRASHGPRPDARPSRTRT